MLLFIYVKINNCIRRCFDDDRYLVTVLWSLMYRCQSSAAKAGRRYNCCFFTKFYYNHFPNYLTSKFMEVKFETKK